MRCRLHHETLKLAAPDAAQHDPATQGPRPQTTGSRPIEPGGRKTYGVKEAAALSRVTQAVRTSARCAWPDRQTPLCADRARIPAPHLTNRLGWENRLCLDSPQWKRTASGEIHRRPFAHSIHSAVVDYTSSSTLTLLCSTP